ncbi:hypothetical protein TRFO_09531 [Tritrichomonas foetus]|uniref:DUF3447 domain-containing protein n=1 Tax=Tritrichomonas foetus TaxID=1144522 RepID=A0A1J4JDI9_9EUKA|nr:hypothetical protein TRFO_09531 [Tritrichomonas foetus]|eukprot:OHS97262.1 hypothetical protein TRFO_09531 [Tritrichomonas foetus]
MKTNQFLDFKKEIEVLSDLQRMVMSILLCDDSETLKKVKTLCHFFEKISISKNIPVYEGFLRLFVHLSTFFNITLKEQKKKRNQELFYKILNELILKHSLKESFHQSTIFFIFNSNKHFVHYLFNKGVVEIPVIERFIQTCGDHCYFLFFVPEMKRYSPDLYQKQMDWFKISEDTINDMFKGELNHLLDEEEINKSQECFKGKYCIRHEIHSQDLIEKLIRTDDLNSFLDFLSKFENYDLNSIIPPSFLENNDDINEINGISLLEYSMSFGSTNIFRYLWLNKVEYSAKSLKYSIIGGNYEIIHILEEESIYKFTRKHYFIALEYYQFEIAQYFLNTIEMDPPGMREIVSSFHQTFNYEILGKYLQDNSPFQEKIIQDDVFECPGLSVLMIYDLLVNQKNLDINYQQTILL